jgi:hypothetical protein
MSTIAAAVFDVVAALPGRACSMQEVVKTLPAIDRESVISAAHRLSEKGVLVVRHHYFGFMYSIAPGAARPTDGRGRPRKCEQSTRWLDPAPPRCAAKLQGRRAYFDCGEWTAAARRRLGSFTREHPYYGTTAISR